MSCTLSRLRRVLSKRLNASSRLERCNPIPAASSNNRRRSSALSDKAASTRPCPIMVYVRSAKPDWDNNSDTSLSLTLCPLIKYSF